MNLVTPERHAGEAKGGGSLRGKYRLTKRTFNYILALRRQLSRLKGESPVDTSSRKAAT